MNKKIFTMIFIFILAIILFSSFSDVQASELSDAFESAQNFISNGRTDYINYQNLYNITNYLYNMFMLITIILAIIIGIILGNRIIFGSIDERADAKHLIVPYLVIITIIAFAFSLWKIILQIIYNQF